MQEEYNNEERLAENAGGAGQCREAWGNARGSEIQCRES